MGVNSINIEENNSFPFDLVQGVNAIQVEESSLTPFDLNLGFNSIAVSGKPETYFELLKGFNGVSVVGSRETYFSINAGFNSISASTDVVSRWSMVNEFSQQAFPNGTVTVTSIQGSYSFPIEDGEFTLYPYTDIDGNVIEQTIEFISNDNQSGTITLIPIVGAYTLQLYYAPERENFIVASFGSWNRALDFSEMLHLNRSNPWLDLPVYYDKKMQKDMENWLQFQDGSFYDDIGVLKVENYGSGNDAVIDGFIDIAEIQENISSL